jgi:hypothetical protein
MLRIVFVRDTVGRRIGSFESCIWNVSPDRGVAALNEVMVFVRLTLVFNGTDGGGGPRSDGWLLTLCRGMGFRRRALIGGFGCVGVMLLLLHAWEIRGASLINFSFVLNPRIVQTFRTSTIVEWSWNMSERTTMPSEDLTSIDELRFISAVTAPYDFSARAEMRTMACIASALVVVPRSRLFCSR